MLPIKHEVVENIGDESLTWLLIAAAVVIVCVALFNHNVVHKALVAAYILLP